VKVPARLPEHRLDRWVRNVRHGRFERSLSAITAFSAVVTTAEIFVEHYRASFGDPWMWLPVAVTPPVVVAGVGGVVSKKIAKSWLPATSAVYLGVGLLGQFFHMRGVARRPGGFRIPTYNLAMGPPPAAPGLMSIVGAMGILAAILRRED
jgi:hypothetical protein